MSIDDYLDTLLSGSSEPSSKAIKKLTKLIENFGAIMVKSTERMEDYVSVLDSRISALERAVGLPSGSVSATSAPSFSSPAPAAAPSRSAPAATASAPSLGTPPAASSGAPNLTSAPNLSAAPDLSAAPSLGGDSPAPSMPSGGTTGSGISSADLMKAAANLQKAPEHTPGGGPGGPGEPAGPASFNPLGVSASDIQNIRAGLTKVDQDEHRKEREAAAGSSGGSMPASMALNLEVKDALAKRKSRSDASEEGDEEEDIAPTQAAPAAPQKSTKQMKEALQGELRDAFSSLLESDNQED